MGLPAVLLNESTGGWHSQSRRAWVQQANGSRPAIKVRSIPAGHFFTHLGKKMRECEGTRVNRSMESLAEL